MSSRTLCERSRYRCLRDSSSLSSVGMTFAENSWVNSCVIPLKKVRHFQVPNFFALSVVVHLLYVNLVFFCFAKQMLAEEVGHLPEEILILGLETVPVAG